MCVIELINHHEDYAIAFQFYKKSSEPDTLFLQPLDTDASSKCLYNSWHPNRLEFNLLMTIISVNVLYLQQNAIQKLSEF